jgi:hypothetical protein
MPVPNTFAGATAAIPLSQLDQNFATTITLGNTAIQLGNTVTTLNNMTFANVTISSVASTFPNNYLANSSVTIGNTTVSLGGTTSSLGNVTINNCTVGNATVDSAGVAGFIGIPQNSQNGSYNVVIGDAGKHLYHPVGQAAATYTIPANSNVAFTVGTTISFVNMSANATTIAVTTDTIYLAGTGTTGNRTLAQYGVATAVKLTSTSWIISGTGLT